MRFANPVSASLSKRVVRLIDLSTDGARIEHPFPLPIGKRRLLEFDCHGEQIAVESEVVRSRLEAGGQELTFRSGLRFTTDNEAIWGLIVLLMIERLAET